MKEFMKNQDSYDSMGYGEATTNYKTTLRKEVISVLRGQAMLGLLNNQTGNYGAAQRKGNQMMKEQCENLLATG